MMCINVCADVAFGRPARECNLEPSEVATLPPRPVRPAVGLTRQLLRLRRSHERGASVAMAPVKLADVVPELLPLADQKRLDVGLIQSDAGSVLVEREDLRVLPTS